MHVSEFDTQESWIQVQGAEGEIGSEWVSPHVSPQEYRELTCFLIMQSFTGK